MTSRLLRGEEDLDLKLAVGESREVNLASLGTAAVSYTHLTLPTTPYV